MSEGREVTTRRGFLIYSFPITAAAEDSGTARVAYVPHVLSLIVTHNTISISQRVLAGGAHLGSFPLLDFIRGSHIADSDYDARRPGRRLFEQNKKAEGPDRIAL